MLRSTSRLALASALLVIVPLVAPLPFAAAADPEYFIEEIPGGRIPLTAGATLLALQDNEVTALFPLGFTTTFFDLSTDVFWVGSNGFITLHFLTEPGCCQGQPLPTAGGPDGIIAGWWTDLDPSLGGAVRFERMTLEGRPALVVDYANVPVKGTLATATFQIVLKESGVFEVRLEDVTTPPTAFASVGAENVNGVRGIQAKREAGVRLENIGFRFTPNVPPLPPPVISFVSPNPAGAGSFARVFGDNFAAGAVVSVGNASASTFFESRTSLGFIVPPVGEGIFPVTVRNPDGNETTAEGALQVVDRLDIFDVQPRVARQGDTAFVIGSGFDPRVTLLLDERPVEAEIAHGGLLVFRIPTKLQPGRYDVAVFDPERGSIVRSDALLVLGRPDVLVRDLTATRQGISTFATPTVPLPVPWTVEVTVENAGDHSARDAQLVVTAIPHGPGPILESVVDLGTIAADDGMRVSTSIGTGREVGDYHIEARISSGGVADRDLRNNMVSIVASAYVGGLGGASVDPCWSVERACMWPETRHHERESRKQDDVHREGTLRVDAEMRNADFDFSDFPIVFTRSELLPDGGFRECTTWRFLGGPTGTFRVTMTLPNGLEGFADVPSALSRESNGTMSTQHWSDRRAFGIILTESERSTSGQQPSDPLTVYEFEPGRAAWTLRATGLQGDFTHCAERPASGQGHERFVFAALPANIDEHVASFDGHGEFDTLTVSFSGARDQSTSGPFL